MGISLQVYLEVFSVLLLKHKPFTFLNSYSLFLSPSENFRLPDVPPVVPLVHLVHLEVHLEVLTSTEYS